MKIPRLVDAYVMCIREVAAHLGCGEPQILEVFINTLLQDCIGYYFPWRILRQAVETAKRIFTKEKIDGQ